jgi:hypothetical protein
MSGTAQVIPDSVDGEPDLLGHLFDGHLLALIGIGQKLGSEDLSGPVGLIAVSGTAALIPRRDLRFDHPSMNGPEAHSQFLRQRPQSETSVPIHLDQGDLLDGNELGSPGHWGGSMAR